VRGGGRGSAWGVRACLALLKVPLRRVSSCFASQLANNSVKNRDGPKRTDDQEKDVIFDGSSRRFDALRRSVPRQF